MGRSINTDELRGSGLDIAAFEQASRIPQAALSRVMAAVMTGDVHPVRDIDCDVAVLYVAQDQRLAVLMRMDLGEEARQERLRFTFCGLSPTLRYFARLTCGNTLPAGMPASAPGAFYMSRRFEVPLTGDARGAALLLDADPPDPFAARPAS